MPGIDWDKGTAKGSDEAFVQTLQDQFFKQLVRFPTHIKGNCLDLVLTNIPGKVSEITDRGRLDKSDHVMLQFELKISGKMDEEKKTVNNLRKANWDGIRNGLRDTTWPDTNDEKTAEEAWQTLRKKLDSLIEEFVPKCTFKPRKSDWMTGEILREIRKKRRMWKKAKNGNGDQDYKEAEAKVKNLIRKAKRGLEKRLAQDKHRNSKPFYNYAKKKTSSKAAIGPLLKDRRDGQR